MNRILVKNSIDLIIKNSALIIKKIDTLANDIHINSNPREVIRNFAEFFNDLHQNKIEQLYTILSDFCIHKHNLKDNNLLIRKIFNKNENNDNDIVAFLDTSLHSNEEKIKDDIFQHLAFLDTSLHSNEEKIKDYIFQFLFDCYEEKFRKPTSNEIESRFKKLCVNSYVCEGNFKIPNDQNALYMINFFSILYNITCHIGFANETSLIKDFLKLCYGYANNDMEIINLNKKKIFIFINEYIINNKNKSNKRKSTGISKYLDNTVEKFFKIEDIIDNNEKKEDIIDLGSGVEKKDLGSEYNKQFETDGLVLLHDIYTNSEILELTTFFNNSWSEIRDNLPNLKWKRRQYRETTSPSFFIGRGLYEKKLISEYNGEEILNMGHGRYDFGCGFGNHKELIMNLINNPIVNKIVKEQLGPGSIVVRMGGLPTENTSGSHGYWHRDQYSLFENEKLDVSLPTMYITFLIPLVDLTNPLEGGGTEFVKGSHKFVFTDNGIDNTVKLIEWADNQEKYTPLLALKSALLFHGNVLHRGVPSSLAIRPMIYFVFKKSFYSDEDPAEYVQYNEDDALDKENAMKELDDMNYNIRFISESN